MSKINHEAAINNLKELDMIFKQAGIEMFLLYGTALGAIREGNIIADDLDTDVGIMADQFNWSILNKISDAGFRILHIMGMWHCGMEISVGKNGIKTDIMLIYKDEESGKFWNALWDNGMRNGIKDIIIHSYQEIEISLFVSKLMDECFKCPTKRYLNHVYGKEWQIPHGGYWDWRTSHFCHDPELKEKIINKFGKDE